MTSTKIHEMKKTIPALLGLAALMMMSVAGHGQVLTNWVTSPAAGQVIVSGTSITVTVNTSTYNPNSIGIELYNGTTKVYGPVFTNPPTNSTITAPSTAGGNYKIRVYDLNNSAKEDYSDPFTIGPNLSSWVQAPNTAVGYTIGTNITVQLNTTTYNPSSVTLELYKGATKVWGPTTGTATGRTIPTTGLAAGTDYKVKAYDTSIPTLADWSNVDFKIMDLSNWITSPTLGQVITTGTGIPVTVNTTTFNPSSIGIELYNGATKVYGPFITGPPGSSSISTSVVGGNYRIRVYDMSNSANEDWSDYFTVGPDLSAWIQTPNTSTGYGLNTTISVQLNTTTYNPSSVTLELYDGATKVWGPSTGSATGRTIPLTGLPAGTNYKLKAYDTSIPTLVDWSNVAFKIVDLTNWITSPTLGQVITAGTGIPVTVNTATFNPTTIGIELYDGATKVYGPFITGPPGSSSVSTSVVGFNYRIRVYDMSNSANEDWSEVFVVGPDLSAWIQQPNGGKSYGLNSTINVQLNTTTYNPSSVALELYKGGVKVWGPTTGLATGRTVPLTGLTPGTDYKLKAYDTAIPGLYDQSDNNFSVIDLSNWLTYPNGGETFSSTGFNFIVNTSVYTPASGAPALELYRGTTKVAGPYTIGNNGTFPFVNEVFAGHDYKFRIYDPQNPQNEDYSNTTFTILPKAMNWQEEVVYNGSGNIVGNTRVYVDGTGNTVQSQAKDLATGKVLASHALFDSYHSPVGSTLVAPILDTDFVYMGDFVLSGVNQPYSANDFDLTILSGAAGEVYNPNPVYSAQPGTVGWYYSSNNDIEGKTPVTQFPYSRTYSPAGPDPKTAIQADAGDEFKMGGGHEVKSERIALLSTDLTHYYSLRSYFSTTSATQNLGYKYISTDENGKLSASFVDADGNALATATATYNGSTYTYDNWNYTYYNDIGQVTATVAAKDIVIGNTTQPVATVYKYDHLGRLIETTSPDAGTIQYVYNISGQIRFSQSQEQRKGTKRFSYINYDKVGRIVESGEYTCTAGGFIFEPHTTTSPAVNSVLQIVDNLITVPIEQVTASNYTGVSYKLDAARCTDYTFITYDVADVAAPSAQSFLLGQISKTQNANVTTWYNYDEDGLMVWLKQDIAGLGRKTIDYSYNFFGNVTRIAYQAGNPDAFYHHYRYDSNQRISEVSTSKDGTNKTLQAKYYYYLHGPLKRVELAGNLQGIDYVYTIDGSLKSINHADVSKDPGGDGSNGFSPDIFGLTLDYHPNDYQGAKYSVGAISGTGSTDYYNGLLKSASWFTPIDNPSSKKVYKYSYDNYYQFQEGQFGSLTGTAGSYSATLSPVSAYNEGVSYVDQGGNRDKNGNIQSLLRKGKTGNTLDNFIYHYTPGTNRLASISGSESITYTYDDDGQLTKQEGAQTVNIAYEAHGLSKEIRNASNQLLTSYLYSDRGDLVKRIDYDAGVLKKTTFYVSDGDGNVLAIYEQPASGTVALTEVPIYAEGRIAVYKPGSNTTFYELNDQQGSVRAVIGAPYTDVFTATMETETASSEDATFENIAPRVVFTAANHTPSGNEVIRINNGQTSGGYPGRSTGAAIVLHVAPGDVISAEVYGYYEGGSGYSNTLPLATIVNNVAGAFGGVSGAAGDPGKVFSAFNSALSGGFAGAGSGSGSDTEPAAWLNFIMFDENMQPDAINLPMSAVKITSAANMNKQKLEIGPINIPAPGYVYIYVNDNSNVNNWVYFDDLKVTHLHSPFVAGGDYYPFGLTMEDREIKKEPYRFGYQGQYSEEDSVTGWNRFDLRMYNARIGRWMSTDPYGQFASPYIGMGNNPASGADADGGYFSMFNWQGALAGAALGTAVGLTSDKDNWAWYTLGGAAAGGFLTSDFAKVEIWGTHEGRGVYYQNSNGPGVTGREKITSLSRGGPQMPATINLLIRHDPWNPRKGYWGIFDGHVFMMIDGVDYSFRPQQTRKNGNKDISGHGVNKGLILSDGWIGTDPSYVARTRGDKPLHRGFTHSELRVKTTLKRKNALLDNIAKASLDPPNYSFFIGKRCASFAMKMMRASKVVPATSILHQFSPRILEKYMLRRPGSQLMKP